MHRRCLPGQGQAHFQPYPVDCAEQQLLSRMRAASDAGGRERAAVAPVRLRSRLYSVFGRRPGAHFPVSPPTARLRARPRTRLNPPSCSARAACPSSPFGGDDSAAEQDSLLRSTDALLLSSAEAGGANFSEATEVPPDIYTRGCFMATCDVAELLQTHCSGPPDSPAHG